MWEKKSNFDLAVRVPLLIRHPRKPNAAGRKTGAIVELVDMFPTLASLAGLPPPPGVDGDDVSALFDDPDAAPKVAAFHEYPACSMAHLFSTRGGCTRTPRDRFSYMG